jgi:heme exporter protein B
MQGIRAVFLKEVRTEWRTRVALSGVGLFVIGSLLLLGLSLREAKVSMGGEVQGGLIWVLALFTAATGLGRAFVQESERGTALALRLHARPTDVWLGKFAFNTILLLVLNAVMAPVLFSMLPIRQVNVGVLACVLGMGTVAIAAVFTMMSALVAQTTARGGLLAALAFPVLVPAFQAGLNGTKAALGIGMEMLTKSAWQVASADLMTLGIYTGAALTLSLWLFEFVWND